MKSGGPLVPAFVRLASMAVGLGPGLVLPLVIAAYSTPYESDGFLFATSFSLVMINIVVLGIEGQSMAVVGAALDGSYPSRNAWHRYSRNVLLRGIGTITVVVPLLVLVYVIRDERWTEFIPVVAVVAIAPMAGVVASLASGVLYAVKRSSLPIWTQGLRSALPIAALVAVPNPPLVLLAACFAAGEILRAAVLHIALRRVVRIDSDGEPKSLRYDGLFWQFASSAASQGNPVIDRLFLAGTSVGSITAYELADKVSFAVYQLFFTGLLVPRSGGWGRALKRSANAGIRTFWHTTLKTMAMLFSSTLIIGAAIWLVLRIGVVPEHWETGLAWALIVLPSVTFTLGQMASVRILVAFNAEKALLPAAFAGFLLNIVADLVCFALFGALGVVIATLITRMVVCMIYFGVVIREQKRYLARRA